LLEWIKVVKPLSEIAKPLITDLGAGETEVLMLGLEMPGAVVVLDDLLARRTAENLHLDLTGTSGLLLDAKRAGLIESVIPPLDKIEAMRFRISPTTRRAVLKMSGE